MSNTNFLGHTAERLCQQAQELMREAQTLQDRAWIYTQEADALVQARAQPSHFTPEKFSWASDEDEPAADEPSSSQARGSARKGSRRLQLSKSKTGSAKARTGRRGSAQKGIEGIPQEVFDMILDELLDDYRRWYYSEDPGLLALRSTSRKLNQMTTLRFAEKSFTNTTFIISVEDDRQIALALASHPVFGPAMKEVTLNFDELADPEKAYDYFTKPAAFPANYKLTQHDWRRATVIDRYGPEGAEAIRERWAIAKMRELDFAPAVGSCKHLSSSCQHSRAPGSSNSLRYKPLVKTSGPAAKAASACISSSTDRCQKRRII